MYKEIFVQMSDLTDYHDFVGRLGKTISVEELAKAIEEYDPRYNYQGNLFILQERSKSRGLGDTIANITHATGLDKLATLYTQVTGKPCGCQSRQEALNKLIPYGVKENG